MAKFVPTASIVKQGRGDYRIVTKKSFLERNVEVEKHFKSVTKAYEWAYTHGFTNIEL